MVGLFSKITKRLLKIVHDFVFLICLCSVFLILPSALILSHTSIAIEIRFVLSAPLILRNYQVLRVC